MQHITHDGGMVLASRPVFGLDHAPRFRGDLAAEVLEVGRHGLGRPRLLGWPEAPIGIKGVRPQLVADAKRMVIGDRLAVLPHVDGGVGLQSKGGLQFLDRSEKLDGLFFGKHGLIVSPLTPHVNTLTGLTRNFLDMPTRDLAKRAKSARKRAGFLNEKAAADAIGCSRPLVIRWESGDAKSIGGKYLMEAARVYKVRPEWLTLSSDDDGYPWEPDGQRVRVSAYEVRGVDGEDGVDTDREVMIPVSDIEVSGGPGVIVPEYVETKYRLPFQIEWLRQFGAKPEQVRIARVRGSSMEPTLWDGDKAVIHTGQRRIRNDRVFALIYGGEARVKRISMMADGRLRIVSDNPDKTRYPDEFVSAHDMEQVYIIGQVIDRSGGGGL